jgi:type II secretory pathway pseudopilin PulG
MLIVLAVLAAMASLAWPAVRGMAAKSELRSAAGNVRSALARARLRAIESGVPQRFRYQPGAGRYEALNCGTPDDASGEPAQPSRVPANILPPEPIGGVLPIGVHFAGPDEITAWRDEIGPSAPDRDAPIGSAGWSRPTVFQSNGKTCDLRLRLLGQDGRYVDVKLRGLTGSVKIGHVGRLEDEP